MFKAFLAAFAFLSFFTVAQANAPLDRQIQATVEVIESTGHGSGFVLDRTHIVTAKHVAVHGKEFMIKFYDGTIASGKVVWMSETTDLAIIETSVQSNIEPATVSCRKIEAGEPITIVGYPLMLPLSIEHGYVMSGELFDANGIKTIVLDAMLLPGNSGGPVFDAQGKVIGTADMTVDGHDLGFMVPIPQEMCDAKRT